MMLALWKRPPRSAAGLPTNPPIDPGPPRTARTSADGSWAFSSSPRPSLSQYSDTQKILMPSPTMPQRPALCFGEVLWDALPDGLFLGGAPFNVAAHLVQLEVPAAIVSAVGNDILGKEIIRRSEFHGVNTRLLQRHESLPTGYVLVEVDHAGEPAYEIVQPTAWDAVAWTQALEQAARDCSVLVFGSLAQRSEETAQTLKQIAPLAPYRAFDVNLRQPFVSREVVRRGLELAHLAKLNEGELRQIAAWENLSGSPKTQSLRLVQDFDLEALCVTRGAGGAFLAFGDQVESHPGFPAEVADAVGAGDAFMAMLLAEKLQNDWYNPEASLARANALGAFVASRRGATPRHDITAIERLTATSKDSR